MEVSENSFSLGSVDRVSMVTKTLLPTNVSFVSLDQTLLKVADGGCGTTPKKVTLLREIISLKHSANTVFVVGIVVKEISNQSSAGRVAEENVTVCKHLHNVRSFMNSLENVKLFFFCFLYLIFLIFCFLLPPIKKVPS